MDIFFTLLGLYQTLIMSQELNILVNNSLPFRWKQIKQLQTLKKPLKKTLKIFHLMTLKKNFDCLHPWRLVILASRISIFSLTFIFKEVFTVLLYENGISFLWHYILTMVASVTYDQLIYSVFSCKAFLMSKCTCTYHWLFVVVCASELPTNVLQTIAFLRNIVNANENCSTIV